MEVFGKLKILIFDFSLIASGAIVLRMRYTKLLSFGVNFRIAKRLNTQSERSFIGWKEFSKIFFCNRGHFSQFFRMLSGVYKFAFDILKVVMAMLHSLLSHEKVKECSCFIPTSSGSF